VHNSSLYVFGGINQDHKVLGDFYRYDLGFLLLYFLLPRKRKKKKEKEKETLIMVIIPNFLPFSLFID